MSKLLTAEATALLLILSVNDYGEEKSKAVTRARISRKSVLKISFRKRLRDAFIEEVRNHASDLGWALIEVDEGFGLLEMESARSWTQVSTVRVKSRRDALINGEIAIDDLYEEVLGEDAEENDDE